MSTNFHMFTEPALRGGAGGDCTGYRWTTGGPKGNRGPTSGHGLLRRH